MPKIPNQPKSSKIIATSNRSSRAVFGFDRITIWIDRSELPVQDILALHCTSVQMSAEQSPFQARWKLQIELFQPTKECLTLLVEALGHDISAKVTYVEIACDVPASSKYQAQAWLGEFLCSALMRSQQQTVVSVAGTWYYGRRAVDGVRCRNVLAVYADRPSKLNNAQPQAGSTVCLHIEWRASGAAALERIGIVSLVDLIS